MSSAISSSLKVTYLSKATLPRARIKLIRLSTIFSNKSSIKLDTAIGDSYTGRSKEFETPL
jgi:hypothetical protein